MRNFFLRPMQAMLLVSMCFCGMWLFQFVRTNIVEPMSAANQTFACGTITPTDNAYQIRGLQDGKALFNANCAPCHKRDKDLTGPALLDVQSRWPSEKTLYAFIRNSQAVIKKGDSYTTGLFNKYGKIIMPSFPELTDDEIAAILDYIQ